MAIHGLGRPVVRGTLIIVAVVGVLASEAAAQDDGSSARVRVTGAATYEVPGVVEIEAGAVTTSPADVVAEDETTLQLRHPQTNVVVTLPKTGRSLIGSVWSVDTAAMVLARADGSRVTVPLDAIGKLDISRGPRHRRLVAVLAGIGTWYGVTTLFAFTARLDSAWFALGPLAVAPGAGIAVGYLLRRERWEPIPVRSLGTVDAPSVRGFLDQAPVRAPVSASR